MTKIASRKSTWKEFFNKIDLWAIHYLLHSDIFLHLYLSNFSKYLLEFEVSKTIGRTSFIITLEDLFLHHLNLLAAADSKGGLGTRTNRALSERALSVSFVEKSVLWKKSYHIMQKEFSKHTADKKLLYPLLIEGIRKQVQRVLRKEEQSRWGMSQNYLKTDYMKRKEKHQESGRVNIIFFRVSRIKSVIWGKSNTGPAHLTECLDHSHPHM